MNRDDIVRMVRKALEQNVDYSVWTISTPHLEEFARLVAAAERERIIATNAPEIEKVNVYIKALEDAVAAEREACAALCDKISDEDGFEGSYADRCAAAIRERGTP